MHWLCGPLQKSFNLSEPQFPICNNNLAPPPHRAIMRIPWSHGYLSLTHYAFLIITSCRYHLHLVFFGQLIKLTLAKAVQILKERRNCPSKERWGWPPLIDYVATRLLGLSHSLPQYCLTEWFHQGSALFLPAGARREGARQKRKLYHFLRAPKSFSLSITSSYTHADAQGGVNQFSCVIVSGFKCSWHTPSLNLLAWT